MTICEISAPQNKSLTKIRKAKCCPNKRQRTSQITDLMGSSACSDSVSFLLNSKYVVKRVANPLGR